MADWTSWAEAAVRRPVPGIATERVDLGDMTVVKYTFEPHCTFPLHRHPEGQVVIVLQGSCTMAAGDGTVALEAGGIAYNPPMEPHGITSGSEGVVFLNLITPCRSGENVIEYL